MLVVPICLFKNSLISFCKWGELKKDTHVNKKLLISQKQKQIIFKE